VATWRAAGLTERQIYSLVRSGELVKVRHGAYASKSILAEADEDPGLRHAIEVAAARARRSDSGTASHHSAALIRGLSLLREPPPGTVTLTIPPGKRGGRYRTPVGVTCHVAELPGKHVMERHGVPLTTAARTVIDLARTSPFQDAVVVADSALFERRASKTEMRRVLADCARWPGIDKARKVVEFADPRSESVLESCARVRFAELGLERPELQAPVLDASGKRIALADFCWRRRGVIAEADGMLKYQEQGDLSLKYKRDERLLEAGWELVHFTWAQLFGDPAQVVTRIRNAFARAERLRRAAGYLTPACGRDDLG
jgi:hypothetical protein